MHKMLYIVNFILVNFISDISSEILKTTKKDVLQSFPDTWDRTCQRPSGALCSQWPGTMFPSRCSDHFYLCAADGSSTRIQCPIYQFFDMRPQACVFCDEMTGGACDNYFDLGTPCPDDGNTPTFPYPWDRTCQRPSSATCSQWPGFRFPSRCFNYFYQCGDAGQSIRAPCIFNRVFDMKQQNCVDPELLTTLSCDYYIDGVCPVMEFDYSNDKSITGVF